MHLTRTERDANMFRFYRIEIVRGLFGDWGLVRNWGRIGCSGQLRTDWFDTEADAKDARFDLHMAKAKRGQLSTLLAMQVGRLWHGRRLGAGSFVQAQRFQRVG